MEAAGAYIRAIRDGRKMSRAKVYRLSGVHESQISRIEAGTQDAGYTSVIAVVKAIGGNILDVQGLLSNPNATVEFAQQMAKDFIARLSSVPERDPHLDRALAEEYDRRHNDGYGAERVRAAHIVEELIARPDALAQWLDFGDFLVGRKG